MAATIHIVDSKDMKHLQLLKLPARHRGYFFSKNGKSKIYKKITDGIKDFFASQDVKVLYKDIYNTLIKKQQFIFNKDNVTVNLIDYRDYKSQLEANPLLSLPNKDRGYELRTIDGNVMTVKQLRDGIRKVYNLTDENKIESYYQAIYAALFTRKKIDFIYKEVMINVINYSNYYEKNIKSKYYSN